MKRVYLTFLLFLSISQVFAQDIKAIEKDLIASFNYIDSMMVMESNSDDTTYNYRDSAIDANERFANKLVNYCTNVPRTLTYGFPELLKELTINIATSTDGKFRIYSWSTPFEGTMGSYVNVFQYMSNKIYATRSYPDTVDGERMYLNPFYVDIHQLKLKDSTIYICHCYLNGSSKDYSDIVQLYMIKDNVLNTKTNLIKTKSGLTSRLHFEYDRSTLPSNGQLVKCEDDGKTIKIPVVNTNQQVTNKWITYRFDGQYFVREKK